MLRGTPDDIRNETGSLLVCSVPLNTTEVPTVCSVISCEQRRPRSTSQGAEETSTFV